MESTLARQLSEVCDLIYEVDNKPNKITYKDLSKALVIAADYLGIEDNIEVFINFDDELAADDTDQYTVCGNCDVDDLEVTININPKLTRKAIFTTLMHEMVHAQQMLEGRYLPGVKKSRWEGAMVEHINYYDLPWEKEAFKKEVELIKLFG